MNGTVAQEVKRFEDGWKDDPLHVKPAFEAWEQFLGGLADVSLDFKARPGISYSLRARHAAQKGRELFVLVDVVDDEPESRWLSVCFYADMVNDPDEKGDFVPQGLMGEDAMCFNLDEDSAEMRDYIAARLAEAARNAAS
ncbi:MAG: hypothetical protein HDQ94_01130 [Desulfovibrio sp.]|nr:hypothetical protein [Desulfovibrio sp.]